METLSSDDILCDDTTRSTTSFSPPRRITVSRKKTQQRNEASPTAAARRRRSKSSSGRRVKPLIIFDYDDTLFPTSFLNKRGLKLTDVGPIDGKIVAILDQYSQIINKTLEMAQKIGHVLIVTNAEERWISLTVEKFLPKSENIVNSFQHISARSIFEPTGIVSPIGWKENAFRMVVEEYLDSIGIRSGDLGNGHPMGNGRVGPQVISLGDSAHEREAVLKIASDFGTSRISVKSLKLMERPEIDALIKEHGLIQECLKDIVLHVGNLDLCIQPGAATPSSPTTA